MNEICGNVVLCLQTTQRHLLLIMLFAPKLVPAHFGVIIIFLIIFLHSVNLERLANTNEDL